MKLANAHSSAQIDQKWETAFSRIDLIASVFVVLVLCLWFGSTHFGERGRIVHCASNLAALGKAMNGYAQEHGDALPAGGINLKTLQSSWDMRIFPYLTSGSAKASNEKLAETVPRFFACPSDTAQHQSAPRSYAMGGNDMTPENWPPGRESSTGVGLWWDNRTVLSVLDEDALKAPESLPVVKRSVIPVPADTVLLTEFIAPKNTMDSVLQTTVLGASQQRQNFKDGGATFHHGRFNYLMVDGHVETLSPLQTGAFDGTAGIWSLKKDY